MRGSLSPDVASLIRATPVNTEGFFAGARNAPGATVARMSAAICGAAFPGCRFAHPGYTGQHGGLLRWRMQRPRRNRSPHERSDMRGSLSPDVASLIRATPVNTEGFFAGARNAPGATVARMSAAICGAAFPGCRFAHPGYTGQHGGLLRWRMQRPRRNRSPHERSDMRGSLSPDVASLIRATPVNTEGFFAGARNAPGATVARMSAAICGAAFPGCRFAHPGYTGQHGGLLRWRMQRPRRNRSPHERSDMRGSLSPDVASLIRATPVNTEGFFAGARNAPGATVARMSAAICGAAFPGCRFAHPGYTGQHGGLLRWRMQRPRRNRSPHERSDMRGSLSPDVASLIRATPVNTEGFFAGARNAPGATVARMSAAICGAAFPGCRFAHPGYTGQHGGLLRWRMQRPRRNRSPHERSDMRGSLSPDVASLIRATPVNTEGFFAGARNVPGATVARMSAAICGAAVPGYRFAHPGYAIIGGERLSAGARNDKASPRPSSRSGRSKAPTFSSFRHFPCTRKRFMVPPEF